MGYSFGYEAAADLTGGAIFAAVILIVYLLTFGVSIALYVLQSLGLYDIAKRRGLNNPWLAWVPLGNMWIMATVSDQYQYVVQGKVRNRRKVILGLGIAVMVLVFAVLVMYVMFFVNIFANLTQLDYMTDEQLGMVLMPLLGMLGVCLIMEIVGIVMLVFEYIVLYDLYRSCDPKNATLFLVLSILFPVTMAVFLFLCRKKDGGMPPRRVDPQAQYYVEPPVQKPEF